MTRKSKKPAPEGFAKVWKLLTVVEMQEKYGVGRKQIYRWGSDLELPPRKGLVPNKGSPPPVPRRKQPPENLAQMARSYSMSHIAVACGVSRETVRRWINEAGITNLKQINFRLRSQGHPIPPAKNDREHERAANYLRRFMAVSPCDADGKYKEGGSHYRVGFNVLSHDETIQKANAHQERAMRKILNKSKAA